MLPTGFTWPEQQQLNLAYVAMVSFVVGSVLIACECPQVLWRWLRYRRPPPLADDDGRYVASAA